MQNIVYEPGHPVILQRCNDTDEDKIKVEINFKPSFSHEKYGLKGNKRWL